MGIDAKELRSDVTRWLGAGMSNSAIEALIDFKIAAVIADEAAKATQPAPQPTGDVPEWFKNLAEEIYRNGWQSGTRRDHTPCEQLTRDGWNAVEAEIARRVEAKRKNWEDELHLSIAERHRLMAEVDEEHKCRIHWEGKCGDLQAEVERYKKNAWGWSRGLKGQEPYSDDELKEMFGPYVENGDVTGLSPREARLLETLVQTGAEVERLSRPVGGVDWHALWTRARNPLMGSASYAKMIEPLIQRERNARESAERERDELRAAIDSISVTVDRAITCCQERRYVWAGLDLIRKRIAAYHKHKESTQ